MPLPEQGKVCMRRHMPLLQGRWFAKWQGTGTSYRAIEARAVNFPIAWNTLPAS